MTWMASIVGAVFKRAVNVSSLTATDTAGRLTEVYMLTRSKTCVVVSQRPRNFALNLDLVSN